MMIMMPDFKNKILIICMKLLINIMKKSVKNFFTKPESEGIKSFFILAGLCPDTHVCFFYEDLITNEFIYHSDDISSNLLEEEINKFVNLYIYSKNTFNILKRFVHKWKLKTTKNYEMEFDLYLNPLNNYPNNQLISLLENNTIYKFRLTDLMNIWKDALFNCKGLFPEPSKLKNPYTNLKISKYNLYNIYFAIKNSNFHIPMIIHSFFYCNFNTDFFISKNYPVLKENCINNFVKEAHPYELYEQIENMFHHYRKDISYCLLPNKIDLNHDKINEYINLLYRPTKFYLLFSYSCNTYNKQQNEENGRKLLKRFIKNYPDYITFPVLPPSTSLSTLRRRTSTLRRRRSPIIELPPVNPTQIVPVLRNPTTNRIDNSLVRQTTERFNNLITEIDLAVVNSNASSPFEPSHQIPRTPIRENTT